MEYKVNGMDRICSIRERRLIQEYDDMKIYLVIFIFDDGFGDKGYERSEIVFVGKNGSVGVLCQEQKRQKSNGFPVIAV